jgi:2-polyprenyl-3-methyl-5-hydroxy-6-metoxy-1,4-benzoquinol methylase
LTKAILFPQRSTDLKELMEEPDCDPQKLYNTYVQFRVINFLLSGCRGVYRRFLRPLASRGPLRLLDVGFGGGDIPLALARWARRDGLDLHITAIDTDPRALAFVSSLTTPPELTFREASTAELVDRGERFDIVMSNHLLHHLEPEEVKEFCRQTSLLCRRAAVHCDIERAALAYGLFGLLTRPFFHRSYIVHDGLVSIRRSYTSEELQGLAPDTWRVDRKFPFHQLLIYSDHDSSPELTASEDRGDS